MPYRHPVGFQITPDPPRWIAFTRRVFGAFVSLRCALSDAQD